MLRPILLGGLISAAIAVHCVETKKTKDILRKYCPVFDKFKEKNNNKNTTHKKQEASNQATTQPSNQASPPLYVQGVPP